MDYYFLGALIPSLDLDNHPPVSWRELKELLELNLSSRDFIEVERIFRYFDLENIHRYRHQRPLLEHSNWSLKEIECLSTQPSDLNDWLYGNLDNSGPNSNQDCFHHHFFVHALQGSSASARVLSSFWQSQWIMAYVRANQLGQLSELYNEPGADHPQVLSWLDLLKSGSYRYEIDHLNSFFEDDKLPAHEIALRALKWQVSFLEEQILEKSFSSLDKILNQALQLALIEQWHNRFPDPQLQQKLSIENFKFNSTKGK
jgi:hypothetical protein